MIARADIRRFRIRFDRPVGGSGVAMVDVIAAVLADAEGVEGLGFSYVIGGGGEVPAAIASSLAERFLIGKPLPAPRIAWRRMAASFGRSGPGPNLVALAALDVALWDLVARRAGVPLAVALGGEPRAVPVYASGGFRPGESPGAAAEAAVRAVQRGYRGVKPRVTCARADEKLIERVAGILPPGVELMLDANEKGDLARAPRLLAAAAAHGALFVEEPLPATLLPAWRALRATAPIALAGGEHLQTIAEILPFLSEGILGVVQPDLAMMGGLSPCLAVAELAAAFGIAVAPHFLPGLFVHLAAAAPAVTWLEDLPLIEPLFAGWPEMTKEGLLAPREAPGHGLTLAEDAERRFPP
jgi:L-alanine-DL-glutamate epimerase-like enolase superfamily enzyme